MVGNAGKWGQMVEKWQKLQKMPQNDIKQWCIIWDKMRQSYEISVFCPGWTIPYHSY